MNVLLIGKRARILNDVADQLRTFRSQVTLTNNLDIEQLTSIDVSQINTIAYGRALTPEQKGRLTELYKQKNPSLAIVEGWAPIPELITFQILASTNAIPGLEVDGTVVTSAQDMNVHIKSYRLNWIYQVKTSEADIALKATIPTDITKVVSGFDYFVLEDNGRYTTIKRDT